MIRPPKWAKWLLEFYCRPEIVEDLEGDLNEYFQRNLATKGRFRAKLIYCIDVIKFFRPYTLRKPRYINLFIQWTMIKNYFSVALRHIRHNPLYTFINMLSLAIGLASCLAIYMFIKDETSFDNWHSKKDYIYRLDEVQNFTGTNTQKVALTMSPMAPALMQDFPEVKSSVRFWNMGKQLMKDNEQQFLIDNVAAVDSTFLEMFDFPMISGDRTTALDEPNTIVLTEETAAKFFKTPADAIGRGVFLPTNGGTEFKVTGLLRDVPENSHLKFDALVSVVTMIRMDSTFNSNWGGNFLNTYVELYPGTDVPALEAKFKEFMIRHTGQKDIWDAIKLYLQPLDQVHLGSSDIEHDYNNYRKFNGAYLAGFYFIGAFILLIASVKFMNLTTARASHRWKEIGVRASIGAKKAQLFTQFIFESCLLAVLSLVLAVIMNVALLPIVNQLIGRQLSFDLVLRDGWTPVALIVVAVGLGLLAGVYPSFYMTSFKTSAILKGGGKTDGKSIFRSSLVVLQFGLALAMIVSTLVVVQQLSFMQNKDIGFNKDQVVLIGMNREVNEKFQTLKEELLKSRFVKGVTASGQRIGNNFHQWGFQVKTDTGIVQMTPSNVNVEFDYLKVYDIKIKEGRNFSRDVKRDAGYAFIVNEAFAKELGLKETVGTPAGHGWYKKDSLGSIIGVAQDFHFNSLHHKINTLSLVVHPDWGYDEISVKIEGTDAAAAVAAIREIWNKQITYPFSYSFLDQHFQNLYSSDRQMSAVVTMMATLAILICCMGLFGLVTITTVSRTKEVGIRKALGATEFQITTLLSQNFLKLILVSFIIVSPVTYWLLRKWLDSFAYHVSINPLLFLVGGLIALAVALLTISYHTIKSARANPVKALRYE
ncbi:MAG TPA: ABC transporter permease [Cyclobacteriaceae bacterium]|nr:ABC transporter permease [Cyclobacteriaceae bacterium]